MITIIKDYETEGKLLGQIDGTQKDCILVTPYVQLWDRAKDALERAINIRGVSVAAYIRKPDSEKDKEKVDQISREFKKLGIGLSVVPNLHAKIYAFDKSVIVSSMNLYDFSRTNSIELSVLIDDEALVAEVKGYINDHVIRKSEPLSAESKKSDESYNVQPAKPQIAAPAKTAGEKVFSSLSGLAAGLAKTIGDTLNRLGGEQGTCIRCGASIKNDPYYPLCGDCYKKWAVFKNADYTERYCLACGKASKTSYSKPYCYDCFRNG
jgi:hypothetical protein